MGAEAACWAAAMVCVAEAAACLAACWEDRVIRRPGITWSSLYPKETLA